MASRNENSPFMKVISVTIPGGGTNVQCGVAGTADPDGALTFSTFPCRSCTIQYYSGTQVYMAVGRAATVAATSWKLSKTIPMEIEIDDLSKLQFIGTAADVVQIIARV